ncbi:dTMP kinase [Pseudomarimonas arenosa]|uniref:Thymidylate kinase n=1 Tax=Pseudomarimonas arenosa TaxID=2774145 RepID=A0AAW3ZNE6_9GAMM|nr:dTMP kinase [Pseudomarimonas arenosa]MBD8527688.1 dTMP kinase [Pseudomarimonas arenosa]
MSGRLISFEGGEGAGKSSVIGAVESLLVERHIEFVRVREPGGTALGERVRSILLTPGEAPLSAATELLLMFASRAQLLDEVVRPALARGCWVLADRFTDASFAYQGGGRGLDSAWIAELERRVVGRRPDLSLLLDVQVDIGLQRARGRGGEADRIERESIEFFERVRAAYRALAAEQPERWTVLDAGQPMDAVASAAREAVAGRIDLWSSAE